tara:strand:- start:443 stop:1597 length:1155 start_codon:yes stop_codon:yes gene_type:complete
MIIARVRYALSILVRADAKYNQDILLRRTKEFDKPDFISEIFYGINPDFHTVQPTNDAFRANRKLLQDLMTPTFLNGVAAPHLHANFVDLMKLWSEKMRLSKGHPFSVKTDIYETALDAIWAAFFGIEGATVTRNQIDHLSPQKSVSLPPTTDEAVEFKHVEGPPAFEAILRLTDSIEHCAKSPFPRLTGFALRYFPSMRRHAKAKDQAIAEQISKAEARIKQEKGDSGKVTNALDLMLRREKMIAQKQGRAPNYYSKAMRAEVRPFLLHSHPTTSANVLPSSSASSSPATTQPPPRSSGRSNSSPPTKASSPSCAPTYTTPSPPQKQKPACPTPTKSPQPRTTTSTPASRKCCAAAKPHPWLPAPPPRTSTSSATSCPGAPWS